MTICVLCVCVCERENAYLDTDIYSVKPLCTRPRIVKMLADSTKFFPHARFNYTSLDKNES